MGPDFVVGVARQGMMVAILIAAPMLGFGLIVRITSYNVCYTKLLRLTTGQKIMVEEPVESIIEKVKEYKQAIFSRPITGK